MRILRPTYGAAGIFFPIGRPEKGGTCQYASGKCLQKCCALEKDYDEVINIAEIDKKGIYSFFIKRSPLTVCLEIIREMNELQAEILSWFASGDCLDEDIDRIYEIMVGLNGEGIVQNGFTRNWRLYRRIIDGGVIDHIVLTIESLLPKHNPFGDYPRGLWAVPNYKMGSVKLYHGKLGKKTYATCGPNEVATKFEGKEIKIATNCTGCYRKKIGCFYMGK